MTTSKGNSQLKVMRKIFFFVFMLSLVSCINRGKHTRQNPLSPRECAVLTECLTLHENNFSDKWKSDSLGCLGVRRRLYRPSFFLYHFVGVERTCLRNHLGIPNDSLDGRWDEYIISQECTDWASYLCLRISYSDEGIVKNIYQTME